MTIPWFTTEAVLEAFCDFFDLLEELNSYDKLIDKFY